LYAVEIYQKTNLEIALNPIALEL